jgi:hypothetical protein
MLAGCADEGTASHDEVVAELVTRSPHLSDEEVSAILASLGNDDAPASAATSFDAPTQSQGEITIQACDSSRCALRPSCTFPRTPRESRRCGNGRISLICCD